jgi:hypothetical protein
MEEIMMKIDGWLDAVVVWLLRGSAMFLGVCGILFSVLTVYLVLAVMPEVIIGALIGAGLLISSLWLWRKAKLVAAANRVV